MHSRVKRLLSLRPLFLLLLTATLIGATADTAEAQAESRKSPWVAGGLSFVIPGTGQFYNGQWVKGGLMLGGAAVSVGLMLDWAICNDHSNDCPQGAIGAVGYFGIWLWSIIDASRTSKAINRRIDGGQVALEIGPQLIVPSGNSVVGLSLVRVKF